MREPLNETDGQTLKTAVHAMAERLVRGRNTEKTSAVLGDQDSTAPLGRSTARGEREQTGRAWTQRRERVSRRRKGKGRAPESAIRQSLPGLRTRQCLRTEGAAKLLVRIVGQAPLAATVYELERLRCNACGQIFTAQEPEGVGPEKYDETAACDDRADEIRQRGSLLSAGADGRTHGHSAARGDAVGNGRRSRRSR